MSARTFANDVGSARRKVILVVTTHWGQSLDEPAAATRLLAGALALNADIHVAHFTPGPVRAEPFTDSVFCVHELALHGRQALRSGILRAALASFDGGRRVPSIAAETLAHYQGGSQGIEALLETLEPDAVLLTGTQHPFDLATLHALYQNRDSRPRFFVVPFLGDVSRSGSAPLPEIAEIADGIGTVHPGEQRHLAQLAPGKVSPLNIAFSLNRNAALNRLFGVRYFGRYVLLLRSFPSGTSRFERSVTHEVLRGAVAPLSVAEVDGERWRITDAENTLELPVSPSRVNLWRLMAHAEATVDVRPSGPLGREAIESMLLGTPVIVPEGSAAHEHVRAANGGLWYRDLGEMFDVVRAAVAPGLRRQLSIQARRYATAVHGHPEDFVERSSRLVLGEDPRQDSISDLASASKPASGTRKETT